ncbi:MAG: M23 family metallopeptidase [Bacteroidales bacterium]|nr:M23 family metallopeptidase [Bacteroidales bacterium]
MSGQNKKVQSYRLSISDGETHENIWSRRFSKANFAVLLLSVFFVSLALFFTLIAFTPLRTLIPGYPDANSKHTAIQNAIKIDSLEKVITRWELYTENLANVLEGGEPVSMDSVIALYAKKAEARDEAFLAGRDSALKAQVVAAEQFDVSGQKRVLPIEGVHFFVPLKGEITRAYDPIRHPYVDVAASQNTVVKAALGGTVVFDGFNDESGYTIAIQHDDDILTVYKNAVKLMKKTGDRVSAGTSIALAGDGSETSSMHFELWHKGEALNPTDFINF